MNGGTCVNRGLVVVWVSPDAGTSTNSMVVRGEFGITEADGGAFIAASDVPVTNAIGPFSHAGGGRYRGDLLLAGPDGQKTFVAGWPTGGPRASDTLTIEKDTVRPEVTVVVDQRPDAGDSDPLSPGSWKKDEVATVRVHVDGGRPAVATDLSSAWGGTITPTTCAGCAGDCQCFGVDLGGSDVGGMRDTDSVFVNGIPDRAGNISAAQDAGISITRLKWTRQVPLSSSFVPVLPVAVSQLGVVVWGGQEAAPTDPRLFATAQDGGSLWGAIFGRTTVTAGPVVGASTVWVSMDDAGTSELHRINLVGGTPAGSPCNGDKNLGAGTFAGDLALATLNGGVEIPFGIRNGSAWGFSQAVCAPQTLTSFPTTTGRPTIIVQSDGGSVEVFAAAGAGPGMGANRLWKAKLEGSSFSTLNDVQLPGPTQARGLFRDDLFRVGGGGFNGTASIFTTPSNVSLMGAMFTGIPAVDSSPVAAGTNFLVYGSAAGTVSKIDYNASGGTMSDAGVGFVTMGPSLQDRTPVLGAGGLVYVIGDNGYLSVRRVTDMTQVWGDSVTGAGATAVSQPALDVYRGDAGVKDCSKPFGVFYVTTRLNSTATLSAILVDSQGLLPNAPWPKYQHDNANTGNASASLAPWTCP